MLKKVESEVQYFWDDGEQVGPEKNTEDSKSTEGDEENAGKKA